MSGPNYVTLYTVKRFFIFLDEWLFYYVLYKLYKRLDLFQYRKFSLLVYACITIYGFLALLTSYKALSRINEKMKIEKSPLFYPFL